MMLRMLQLTTVVGVASLMSAAPLAVTHAAEPEAELFVIEERTVELPAPAPGEHAAWTFTVENATEMAAPVFVAVTRAEGPLFAGGAQGEVAVGVERAEPVLAGPAQSLLASGHVALATLPANGELRISGEVALPSSAGNDYQGASGSLTIELAATRDIGGPVAGGGVPVADTGGSKPWPWVIGAAGALLAGVLMLTGRRRGATAELQGES